MPIAKTALLADLPPEWSEDLLPHIQAQVRAAGTKIVVLDDDPTGNQTVHDVPVLTAWPIPMLVEAFRQPAPTLYILTNTRSMPLADARALNREIATNLKAAASATGRDFVLVSRSDSTLRGHYPGETAALAEALSRPTAATAFDATLIVPFFIEGGRITAHDVHYVTEGDLLVPAAQTEFARDATFGYTHSNLREWISEKHEGRIAPDDVASLSLDEIRRGGPAAVTAKLHDLHGSRICIVNAVSYRDLEVVVTGLLAAEAQGKRFLYRTAASFVRVRGGITPQPLLTYADLIDTPQTTGGLIVVGSYVQKTTRQVAAATGLPGVHHLEVSVPALLDPVQREPEIARVIANAAKRLRAGAVVLISTSREVILQTGSEAHPSMTVLDIGRRVSSALVAITQALPLRPAWIIAKGGITASDLATDALGVRRAWVLGQAIPGIPIWRTDTASRWPDLVYVVFPGNVGDDQALADMIRILQGTAPELVV